MNNTLNKNLLTDKEFDNTLGYAIYFFSTFAFLFYLNILLSNLYLAVYTKQFSILSIFPVIPMSISFVVGLLTLKKNNLSFRLQKPKKIASLLIFPTSFLVFTPNFAKNFLVNFNATENSIRTALFLSFVSIFIAQKVFRKKKIL